MRSMKRTASLAGLTKTGSSGLARRWNFCAPRSLTLAMPPLSQPDEADCIARAQRGEVAAFSELVTRYQDRIYRFLVRMTRSQEDARELTQETFLSAYQALPR